MLPRYRIVLYQKTDNVSAAIIMQGIEISEPSKGINTTKQAWGKYSARTVHGKKPRPLFHY